MFVDLQTKHRSWVLDVLTYDSEESLLAVLESAVVRPALERAAELNVKKTEEFRVRHVRDYRGISAT